MGTCPAPSLRGVMTAERKAWTEIVRMTCNKKTFAQATHIRYDDLFWSRDLKGVAYAQKSVTPTHGGVSVKVLLAAFQCGNQGACFICFSML